MTIPQNAQRLHRGNDIDRKRRERGRKIRHVASDQQIGAAVDHGVDDHFILRVTRLGAPAEVRLDRHAALGQPAEKHIHARR